MFLIRRTTLLITSRKTRLLNCVCDRYGCGMGFGEEIFSVKIFFFALTPVFSVDFFYNIHSS